MLKTKLDQSPEQAYLQKIESKYGGVVEKAEEDPLIKKSQIKLVSLEEFEQKIKNRNFITKVVSSLTDLYEWKLEQYQKRIEELLKVFKKDDRVIRRAALSEEERKEAGMSSSSNLKLIYASLADTFDLVNAKYIELASAGDEIISVYQQKFMNIIYDPEKGLKTLIGNQYENIKISICTLLSSLEGGMKAFTNTFQNIVIVGPAGVGKTTLAKYLAFYYNESGILATDIVNVITRPDLVGQYLGETGMKTKRRMIDALEGIIFIDEAYQLGGCPDPDTYGMESITEIVNFLDKYMALNITIVAGYENEMNLCFFSRNEGLRRRFPNQYKLKDYKFYDLFIIFMKGCYKQIFEFYSLLSKSKNPEKVFEKSTLFLNSVYRTFEYLNTKVCQRLINELDKETGQYVKDKDTGLYRKILTDTSCYFQNQGGDVGILVAKFFNYFYNKINPSRSSIGAVIDLGIVKQVNRDIIGIDVENMVNDLFKSPNDELLTENEEESEVVEVPKQVGQRQIKIFTIPDLVKIMGAPSDKELNRIFAAVDIEKLRKTLNDLSQDIDSKNNYPKSWLVNKAKLFGEVFTQAQAEEAAQFVLERYQEWLERKEKAKKPIIIPPARQRSPSQIEVKEAPVPIQAPVKSPPKIIIPGEEKEKKSKKKEKKQEKETEKGAEKEGTPSKSTPKKTKKTQQEELEQPPSKKTKQVTTEKQAKSQKKKKITQPGEQQPGFEFKPAVGIPVGSPMKTSPTLKFTAKDIVPFAEPQDVNMSPKEKGQPQAPLPKPGEVDLWAEGYKDPNIFITRIDPNKILKSIVVAPEGETGSKIGPKKGTYDAKTLKDISIQLNLPTTGNKSDQAQAIYQVLKENKLV